MDAKRLEGKVALVTGSGRGFGRGIALAYANEGATVIAASLEKNELDDLVDHSKKTGGNIVGIRVDLSNQNDILKLRDKILPQFKKLDVLVNNAAVSLWKTLEETTPEDWDYTLDVNLRAYFLNVKTFLPSMKENGRGSVINITSTSAEMGFVAEIAYCPSKYAIEGLTQCMALELRPYNIAVNSLNVSSTRGKQLKPTSLTLEQAKNLPPEMQAKYADYDDLAHAFADAWVFLALQDGHGVTGQRFRTAELDERLKVEGWDSIKSKNVGKLTQATYLQMDFPKSVQYQTAGGGWKEINYS
ncbi:MAG: SDR family oxidoreductase [Thaumarchaeota archaeon]|nr:SDR family oxidoreductase [Nitrososphaerota archaeon]